MFVLACALAIGCGKKGPPLPPLVRLPAPPTDVAAERRGDVIDVQFTIPAANTDNSRPANLERVDVYGLTGSSNVSDVDLLRHGTKIGSVDVKAPRDPDATVEPDQGESESDVEPPTGKGLDQGARAHVDETISPETIRPPATPEDSQKHSPGGQADGPLLGPAPGVASRTYVSVGITTRGRKGPMSKRVTVPLVPPPSAPAAPIVTYTESTVSVRWTPPDASGAASAEAVLAARLLGALQPKAGFTVYDVAAPAAPAKGGDTRLTTTPIAETAYADSRMDWGAERCYVVRSVVTVEGVLIESDASPPTCVTLTDTFPPAPPKGLTAVATEGAISLIWDPNGEKDLAGYIVLRGVAPGDTLAPITPAPLAETTFKDNVQAGIRYVYAVQAIDKAGNASGASNKVEETAR